MKKLTLLTLSIALVCHVYAQPVISHDQYMLIFSDSVNITRADGLDPGTGGANMTWNFADLPEPQAINIQEGQACPGGDAICAQFPDATHFLYTATVGQPGLSYTMIRKTAELVESIGGQNNTDPAFTYSDPQLFVKFPITYGQSYSDRYALSTGGMTQYGSKIYTVDGYGTVITPTGTYTDVLRQKIYTYDTIVTATATIISVGTGYTWLKANQQHAILAIVEAALVAPVPQPLGTTVVYSRMGPGGTGIDSRLTASLPVRIFPNPAREDRVQVSADGNQITALRITDVTGKAADASYERVYGGDMLLHTGALGRGIYLVTVCTDKGNVVKKLVVDR